MRVPVIKAPWLFLDGWAGFALPFCVVVKEREEKLIKHEMKHVEQWWRYGVVGFPFIYLYYLKKYGYMDHPLEIEAREAENERS